MQLRMRNRCFVESGWMVVACVVLLSACSTATVAPALDRLNEPARNLVDPRIGSAAMPQSTARDMERAWSSFRGARLEAAEQMYADLTRRDSSLSPAVLGLAAVSIARGNWARADELISQAVEVSGQTWPAAEVYRAEVARASGDLASAWMAYESVGSDPLIPSSVFERRDLIRAERFQEILDNLGSLHDAAPKEELARQALVIRPDSILARIKLVEILIAERRFDDAQTEIGPLIDSKNAELNQVQAALAEIEMGRGSYPAAIRRWERLVERTGDQVYAERFADAKDRWNEANLPLHYQRSARSSAITREELAILSYWKLDEVRFARPSGAPPIAVDIADVDGRQEIIRALALGLMSIDPITREANPLQPVRADTFLQFAARVTTMGADLPECARGTPRSTPAAMLEGCGIDVERLAAAPDSFVDGRTALRVLRAIGQLTHPG